MKRRTFLKMAAAMPLIPGAAALGQCTARPAPAPARPPLGMAMFTLRDEDEKDRMGTLDAVAGMGYAGVEFFGRYYDWTPEHAKDVRARLDDLGLRCFSTHTARPNFTPAALGKAAELNLILGSRYVVMAHSGQVTWAEDGWKVLADELTQAHETLRPQGLGAGFHNWADDWVPHPTYRGMDVLAANTPKDLGFQIDTGGAFRHRTNLVEFCEKHPGRVRSLHLKDWTPETNATGVIFGEGVIDWLPIFEAAERVGGVEYYLMEQEGSRLSPLETSKVSIETYRTMRGI